MVSLNKYLFLTWTDFEKVIVFLEKSFKNDAIIGIYGEPRGGLPLSVALSHRLKKPLVNHSGQDILWIDDIIDSGKTFFERKNNFGYHACWITRENDASYKYYKKDSRWVVFPWEVVEQAEEDSIRYAKSRL